MLDGKQREINISIYDLYTHPDNRRSVVMEAVVEYDADMSDEALKEIFLSKIRKAFDIEVCDE